MNNVKNIFLLVTVALLTQAADIGKEEVDKVIEDEITHKLSEDLLQSLEKKFQVDLQRSVDTVLLKIKILLKNGTSHIQEKLGELQEMLDVIKHHGEKERGKPGKTGQMPCLLDLPDAPTYHQMMLDQCLTLKQNETSMLAEKALHQMVVCGYALIGHDPAQAVHSVMSLKNMIREGIRPIYDQKAEVYELLRVCGHDHDTLKKVIKCVISKSPIIKSAMFEITSKLIDGVVGLTKLMAHGAMHEACLIEVIRSIEDEAFLLVEEIRKCAYSNTTITDEASDYIKQNNATVLDIVKKEKSTKNVNVDKKDTDMKDLIRRMLADTKVESIDATVKDKLLKFTNDLNAVDANQIEKSTKKD